MGKNLSKISYFRNFNLENRISKHLEKKQSAVQLSPRHPSTQEMFKKIEQSAPDVDEVMENKLVVEKSKDVKVFLNERIEIKNDKDRRPKKENEFFTETLRNLDYEKYGYVKPEKIKHGFMTLRQFDETINKYAITKSMEEFNELINNNSIEKDHIPILIEYYKPFYKLNPNKTNSKGEKNYLTSIGEPNSS